MPDREKVKTALKYHKAGDCSGCPYDDDGGECINIVMSEALELIELDERLEDDLK